MKEIRGKIDDEKLIQKKHAQIVEAASKLFSEKGYHSTTMRNIAEESKINLSYLYQYISTKDDILYLFYKHLYLQWEEIYNDLQESIDENPIEQLKKFVHSMLEISINFDNEILTMLTESRHLNQDSMHCVLSSEAKMVERLEQLILRGLNQGVFKAKDTHLAANIIQHLLTVIPLRGWNFRNVRSFKHIKTEITESILKILGVH